VGHQLLGPHDKLLCVFIDIVYIYHYGHIWVCSYGVLGGGGCSHQLWSSIMYCFDTEHFFTGVLAIFASQCQLLESPFVIKNSRILGIYWLEIQSQLVSCCTLTLTVLACAELYCWLPIMGTDTIMELVMSLLMRTGKSPIYLIYNAIMHLLQFWHTGTWHRRFCDTHDITDSSGLWLFSWIWGFCIFEALKLI